MQFSYIALSVPSRVWWPFFVVLFYILAPIPTIVARRYTDDSGNSSNPCLELAIFITMGFVVSSFALPIVLARSPTDQPVVCYYFINHPLYKLLSSNHTDKFDFVYADTMGSLLFDVSG